MGRKKNTEAIIQIFILIAIVSLLIYAMISKKVNYYVHPRFYIGIWFSIIILILFAASLISKVEIARHNVNVRHYMIFVIPLAAALLFPASGVSGKDMTMMNSNRSESESTQKNTYSVIDDNTNSVTDENVADDMNTDSYPDDHLTSEEESMDIADMTSDTADNLQETKDVNVVGEVTGDISEKYTQYEQDGVMVINDDIFAEWYCDVYDSLDAFKGKKCKYLAQVYSMEDFEENQFLAGRYFMVCCAADLVGYGIVCESDKRIELKDEEWITVEGTIGEYEYNGYMVPLLTDVTITEAEAPDVMYIYYNNNY